MAASIFAIIPRSRPLHCIISCQTNSKCWPRLRRWQRAPRAVFLGVSAAWWRPVSPTVPCALLRVSSLAGCWLPAHMGATRHHWRRSQSVRRLLLAQRLCLSPELSLEGAHHLLIQLSSCIADMMHLFMLAHIYHSNVCFDLI